MRVVYVFVGAILFASIVVAQDIPEERVPTSDWEGLANLALQHAATAKASSVYADGKLPIHQIAHLNDGLYNNPHLWISQGEPSWVEIDLGMEYGVSKVCLGSEHTAHYNDRAVTCFSILTATEYDADSTAPTWRSVFEYTGEPVRLTTCFEFLPVVARWVRITMWQGVGGEVRIDELEVYGDANPEAIAEFRFKFSGPPPAGRLLRLPTNLSPQKRYLRQLFFDEEVTRLRRELSQLGPQIVLPLPTTTESPKLDGLLQEGIWKQATATQRWATRKTNWEAGPAVVGDMLACWCSEGLCVALRGAGEVGARLVTIETADGEQSATVICRQTGFYLDIPGKNATIEHRRIKGALSRDRATVEILVPKGALPEVLNRSSFRLRFAVSRYSLPEQGPAIEVRWSSCYVRAVEGFEAIEIGLAPGATPARIKVLQHEPVGIGELRETDLQTSTSVTFGVEPTLSGCFQEARLRLEVAGEEPYALVIRRYAPLAAALADCRRMLRKIADPAKEEAETLQALERQYRQGSRPEREVLFEARVLRQRLTFQRPELNFEAIVFAKHHIYMPSHIYTEYSDAPYRPGGGIYVLSPLSPGVEPKLVFDGSNGICRDPDVSFDGKRILFSYREGAEGYYHIYEMNADGSDCRQLTDGPFHDMNPCYLPNGRIVFTSTRCRSRVLCFSTTAATLFIMDADGRNIGPLSANNVNDFTPDVMLDGRILYTRWEYLDKGADYVQALWAMNPDGTNAAQIFGNNLARPYTLFHARQIPGSHKIVCTLGSHWGDHVGPIAIVDPRVGFNSLEAIRNITPEYPTKIAGAPHHGYRDPYPLSEELFLVSYGPEKEFALYLMDDKGHKELIHADPDISCFDPIPLKPRTRPPVVTSAREPAGDQATLLLLNIYEGLGDVGPRGMIKYLRIVEEQKHSLPRLADGGFQEHFPNFRAHYASPWEDGRPAPAIAAKYVHGIVPVEPDGSAYFRVPANRPIYFQALDENFTEVQRMRSYIHPRPRETLTCLGCHEPREHTPAARPMPLALRRPPSSVKPPFWGGGVFSYRKLVQPIFDRRCIKCHSGPQARAGIDLSAHEEEPGVPVSYRTLTRPRFNPPREPLVNFIDNWWGNEASVPPTKPLSFGTLRSDLIKKLDSGHQGVRILQQERLLITTWIDLNCPLWDNYSPELHAGKYAAVGKE